MKKILAILLVLLLVLAAGCLTETPASEADTAITEEVDSVETLSDDLDASELDNLDQDLAEINW